MKNRILPLALALAAIGGSASAQDYSFDAARLYGVEGTMTQVSDGLYARVGEDGESYVAVSPAGHRALLQKLLDLRAHAPAAKSNKAAPFAFDDLIDLLSTTEAKNQDVGGDCNGPINGATGPLRAQALAGGMPGSDYGGSSKASNTTNPIVNTTNKATAYVQDRNGNQLAGQSVTQYGATAAIATAYNAQRGCTAQSSATVTCPGHANPSLTAIAYNARNQYQNQYGQWVQCTPN
jgi:hypothetical protein